MKKIPIGKMKPKNISEVLPRLFKYYRPYKKSIIWTIIISFIAAILATVNILIVGFIYDRVFNESPNDFTSNFLITFSGVVVGLILSFIFSNICQWLPNLLTVRFGEKATYKMRQDIFEKLHTLPIKYFDQTPSGELMSRISNDIDNISQMVSQYLGSFVYWCLSIIFITILMFLVNWALTLIALISIPVMILINLFIVKKIHPFFTKQQQQIGQLNGFTEEMVSGTKIISLFKMQKPIQENFKKINDELTKSSIIAQVSSNMMMPINTFINNLIFVIICVIGISLIVIPNSPIIKVQEWSVIKFSSAYALLIVFTTFVRNFTNPINQIVSTFAYLLLAIAGAERVFEILDQKPEKDSPSAKNYPEIKGEVQAINLNFGYDPKKLILKNLNFKTQAGKMIAIVGPTGAGKTTIVNLITKFYDLTSGDLLIDGVSIKNITMESLRKNITMVLQETYLFGVSVKENLKYGRLDATDSEIIEAAKEANAHDFIMQLPNGYDTILEDNGEDLSQGQRQLLAITRSFLAKPKIVILDEATSSIDTKTELAIAEAMQKLMQNKTSFVIAHRLSTIKNADNILVLDHGEIIESGTHKALMKKKGFYAELYNTQFKKGMEI